MSEAMRKHFRHEETFGYCCETRREAMRHSPDTLGQVTDSIMYLAIERRNMLAAGAARPNHADLPAALVCPFCGQGIQQ